MACICVVPEPTPEGGSPALPGRTPPAGSCPTSSAADHVDLSGRTALVTGASSGIGRATAVALARAGAKLELTGRDPVALEEVARATGGTFLAAALADPRPAGGLAGGAAPAATPAAD